MALVKDILFQYLQDVGIEYMFGVPGTNEIPIIDEANAGRGLKYIPCLHENIAMGAATGYSRMTGKPGVVELHVTPGIGHSIGNLFNAWKSHSPLLVLCGQQHSQLILQEPLLASNVTTLARQYTKWAYELRRAEEAPLVIQRALKIAIAPPTGPVFVSIPWDYLLQDIAYSGTGHVTRIAPHFLGDPEAIEAAIDRLAAAKSPVIVVGDGVGYANAWQEIQQLADLIGAEVYSESQSSMMNYPNHLHHWQGELPGFQEQIQARFNDHDVAFLCGFNAQAQLVVFDYDKGPLIPDHVAQIYLHNDSWEIGKNHYGEVAILGDIRTTLPHISNGIAKHRLYDAQAAQGRNARLKRLSLDRQEAFSARLTALSPPAAAAVPSGTETFISGQQVAQTLADLQATLEGPLVYVHEAVSDATYFQHLLTYQEPTSYYGVEGGSLGYSMPASLGIKLAVGESRTVVNVVGDGSALFYPNVWWTAKKFALPILYVILNNREYKTLLIGLREIGNLYHWQPASPPDYLYLQNPEMSFVQVAASFGIDGAFVSDPSKLRAAMEEGLQAVKQGHPYVLEILTDPALPAESTAAGQSPHLQMVYSPAKEELL